MVPVVYSWLEELGNLVFGHRHEGMYFDLLAMMASQNGFNKVPDRVIF